MSEGRPETLTTKFLNFFGRSSSCSNIFTPLSSLRSSQRSKLQLGRISRQIILLEDIPNVLHPRVQEAVHDAFRTFIETPADQSYPCVIIVSDAGLRGESEDGSATAGRGKEVMDIRAILPLDLLEGPFVQEVR